MTVLAFGAGVCAGAWLPLPEVTWLGLLLLTVLLAGLVLWRCQAARAAGLVAVLVAWSLTGAACYYFQAEVRSDDDVSFLASPQRRLVRLRGRVTSPPAVRLVTPPESFAIDGEPWYRSTALLRVTSRFHPAAAGEGCWQRASGRVRVTLADTLPQLRPGDLVEVVGWLSSVRAAGNPGQFDLARRAARQGVRAALRPLSVGNVKLLEEGGLRLHRWPARARERLTAALVAGLGPGRARWERDPTPLLLALLLGERGYLGGETRQQLVSTGTMHFLSISGLHVGIVAGAVWLLLRVLGASRRWSALMVLGVVVFYVMLTGIRPGAVRAAVMCGVLCGGILLSRPPNRANSLAFAALVILAVNPAQLFDAGFQLTFVAVTGILAFCAPVHRWLLRWLSPGAPLLRLTRSGRVRLTLAHWVAGLLAVGVSAWLAVLPILAAYFHVVTPYAVLLSVVFFPVVVALVVVGFVYLALLLLWSALAAPLGLVVQALVWVLWVLLSAAVHLPGVVVYVAAPSVWFLVCYYVLLTAAGWGLRRPGGWGGSVTADFREPRLPGRPRLAGRWLVAAALLAASLFLIAPVVHKRPATLRLTMMDVGHGLATLVELPNGSALLFDAGGGSPGYDAGANVIAPLLRSRNAPRLRALVLSHSHWDHCGGVPGLLARFPVDVCFVNRFFAEAPFGAEVLAALNEAGVPVHPVSAGDEIRLDEAVTVRVINPPRGPLADVLSTNDASIALLLEYGSQRVLLLADVAGGWLRPVLEQVGGPVDVLLVPHHGLGDVALDDLVHLARPRYALISSAWGERQQLSRQALEAAGATTLTTYERGCIVLELDGTEVRASTFRDPEPTPQPVMPPAWPDETGPVPEEKED